MCDLPPLHACLHHRHVHPAVRGEDLAAEERINLHLCDIYVVICVTITTDGGLDIVDIAAGNEDEDNLKSGP